MVVAMRQGWENHKVTVIVTVEGEKGVAVLEGEGLHRRFEVVVWRHEGELKLVVRMPGWEGIGRNAVEAAEAVSAP